MRYGAPHVVDPARGEARDADAAGADAAEQHLLRLGMEVAREVQAGRRLAQPAVMANATGEFGSSPLSSPLKTEPSQSLTKGFDQLASGLSIPASESAKGVDLLGDRRELPGGESRAVGRGA